TRSARPGKRLHERILHPLGEVPVGADQTLTDLDLDAEVSVRGEPPAQRGGEAVGSPAVGMVPPYGGLRQAELERTAPFAREGALQWPCRVVEEGDIRPARHASEDRRERVHPEVQHPLASL